jgi:hypothetical protein
MGLDVIETLSELGKALLYHLKTRLTARPRPSRRQAQLRRPHRATASLKDLCVAGQCTKIYLLRAFRAYLRDATGYITSSEQKYKLWAYLQKRNNWTDDVYDCISWPAYRSASALLTDSVRTFVVKLNHGWLPVGISK